MFTDYVFSWLANALDFGISEADFWSMTIAELERAIESKRRVLRTQAQEKASFDYILADLIGRSIARVQSSANKMPDIAAAYPSLFDSEEIEQARAKKKVELSVLRFKAFTQSHNAKYKGDKVNNE